MVTALQIGSAQCTFIINCFDLAMLSTFMSEKTTRSGSQASDTSELSRDANHGCGRSYTP
jgi:hypothetical protein